MTLFVCCEVQCCCVCLCVCVFAVCLFVCVCMCMCVCGGEVPFGGWAVKVVILLLPPLQLHWHVTNCLPVPTELDASNTRTSLPSFAVIYV